MERAAIGDINISKTRLEQAGALIDACRHEGRYGYICFMNTRTAHIATNDAEYLRIQNGSLLTFPDGAPLVWLLRNYGEQGISKVSGKDFMDYIFSLSVARGYSHYFYGSTDETLGKLCSSLRRDYPGISIVGAVSPPFQPLENFDIATLAREVNSCRPTFFWCGLGAPKQERLNAMLQGRLDATFCAGVGLAFEYVAGTVKRAPEWMRSAGLEWLYRDLQQPDKMRRALGSYGWMIRKLLLSSVGRR